MNEFIKEVVQKWNSAESISGFTKLYGDASYRTYFRLQLTSGTTLILMKLPEGKSSASEEITNHQGVMKELPYINISHYLEGLDIAVPKILYFDDQNEALLLEDLGDHLLFNDLSIADDNRKEEYYKSAIDLLCDLQKKTSENEGSVAFERSFDATLLNWEFDHFFEYGIEVMGGNPLPIDIKEALESITRRMTDDIMESEYGFTHRDFQSRNIMVKEKKLYLIDFQDALKGPRAYDLVALLRDSYVEIPDNLLDNLIKYYCDQCGLDCGSFRQDFDRVTIQRKLKDAGRFVYIDRVKGNASYLQYIPRSLGYVQRALKRQNDNKLIDLLKPYIQEWQ